MRAAETTTLPGCAQIMPLLAALLLACASWPMASAADAPATASAIAPLVWSDLSSDQQQLLSKLQDKWGQLPAARQHALARGAQRWLDMPEAERTSASARFREWQKLPDQRRALIRKRWAEFQALDPATQAQVRANFRAYRQLSPELRNRLRQQWQRADANERRRLLLELRQRRRANQ